MKKKILTWKSSMLALLLAAMGVAGCEKPDEEKEPPSSSVALYGVKQAQYQPLKTNQNIFLDNKTTRTTFFRQNHQQKIRH